MNLLTQSLRRKICRALKISLVSGKDRVVLVLGFLGIAIKFPKTKEGNRANFGELYFWKKTHHAFCQPTLLCIGLYGLNHKKRQWINIQKAGYRACESDPDEFKIKCSILTRRVSETDDHHFKEPANFFFNRNDKLVTVDYGSRQTRRVIQACGLKIHFGFDEKIRCTFDDLVNLIETLEGIRLDHKH